ncbi:MAG: permease prefix domain 2-containing transporter [Bryobacteraceae bacterium]|jgi:hypothetical protein
MKPPLLAQSLLMAVAGPNEAEYIAGDLEEEFAMIREARGSAAARRWYAWQVARSVCALLQLRVRTGELTQVMLIASLGVGAPLLLLDRLWQFVYSQIPLKDGLHRAPEFLAFNAFCVCACAAILGAWAGSKWPGSKRSGSKWSASKGLGSKSRAVALAFAAMIAVLAALWAGSANTPGAYVVCLSLAVPASALLTFAWRKSR